MAKNIPRAIPLRAEQRRQQSRFRLEEIVRISGTRRSLLTRPDLQKFGAPDLRRKRGWLAFLHFGLGLQLNLLLSNLY